MTLDSFSPFRFSSEIFLSSFNKGLQEALQIKPLFEAFNSQTQFKPNAKTVLVKNSIKRPKKTIFSSENIHYDDPSGAKTTMTVHSLILTIAGRIYDRS